MISEWINTEIFEDSRRKNSFLILALGYLTTKRMYFNMKQ